MGLMTSNLLTAILFHSSRSGSPNVLSEGRISYFITYRGQDVLRTVIVLGYVPFYQINKILVIFFHDLTK